MLRIYSSVLVFFMCFSALVWSENCKPIYGEKRSFSSPMIQEIYDRTASVNLAVGANIYVGDIVNKYIPVQMDKAEKEALLIKQGFELKDKYSVIYVFRKCPVDDKNFYRTQMINISRGNGDDWAGYGTVPKLNAENLKENVGSQQ